MVAEVHTNLTNLQLLADGFLKHIWPSLQPDIRGGSRTAATSKMELFVIIVKDFQPLTIITKRSILDIAAILDPPLDIIELIDIKLILKYIMHSFSGFY